MTVAVGAPGTQLWIVGVWPLKPTEANPEMHWELVGVFSTEARAVAACFAEECWVAGPLPLDEPAPRESVPIPGFYYPRLGSVEP